MVFLDGTLELKGIESASKIDPGCTLFTTESNYGHVTFDIQKLAVKPEALSLSCR